MATILTAVHITVCLFLIVIVLLQHGKGASIGASFGGASNTLFGADGPMPLMNKVTTGAAVIFMLTSISLAFFSSHQGTGSVMSDLKSTAAPIERSSEQPAAAVPAAPGTETSSPAAEGDASPVGSMTLPRTGEQKTE